ncbi:MAG: haloacid dehalogenase-like hydrolase, partial [Myxococcales bacterium]|nr:haloacid dehalogenase-like hydrolase [Myxococcales bacterium]
ATSSTLYAALAAQELWGFDDVVCTRMSVADGVFTGGIDVLAYGDGKLDATRAWAAEAGVDLTTTTFYTDSVTDRALMETVGTPVAVNPDRELRRLAAARGWAIEDWGRNAP